MKGNIITREKCCICNATLKHDDRRHGLFCPKHPQISAVKIFIVRFGGNVQKQFNSYEKAAQFLNGVRFKTSEGTFDPKDYQSDEGISEKTRANYMSRISDFWKWILKRRVINLVQMPIFPGIEYELGYRTITDIDTQEEIIKKVFDMTYDLNPKIWLGIDLLATYVNLRPGDLLKLQEADVDIIHGELTFHYPTKRKNKLKKTRVLDHHIEIITEIKNQYPGLPNVKFFRHHGGVQSVKPNQPFGPKYFKKRWDEACRELGITGLDLYGGTRHTTTTEIARRAGTINARKASAHETNKAFDRYCQFQEDTAFDMAKIVKGNGKLIPLKKEDKK